MKEGVLYCDELVLADIIITRGVQYEFPYVLCSPENSSSRNQRLGEYFISTEKK